MADGVLYRGYDRETLDAQYNNRRRFPGYQSYFDGWADRSDRSRQRLEARLDLAYGNASTEVLDVFPADTRDAPIQVFIHGGYWQSLDKSGFSYVAEGVWSPVA